MYLYALAHKLSRVYFLRVYEQVKYTLSIIIDIQSTLVFSTSKGPSVILRDIHTSTYQICRTEVENKSNNHILQMNM